MKTFPSFKLSSAALAAVVLSLASTAVSAKSPKHASTSTQAAETACMAAVNSQYAGKVNEVKVARAEFSQANTEVIVEAAGVRGKAKTERWRCLSSSSGKVADLSVME
jgi:hypothetical protein